MGEFRILVSIVNYCSAELVCKLLPRLMTQVNPVTDRVVIIDNNSSDDSVVILEQFLQNNNYGDKVHFVRSSKNGGFAYGNNEIIRYAKKTFKTEPAYVYFLNPDTLLQPEAIDNLIDFLGQYEKAGIAGSRLEGEDGSQQTSCFNFHTLMSEILNSLRLGVLDKKFSKYRVALDNLPSRKVAVDWVAGASMMIKFDVFRNTGLMDEQYFLYFEETDFCLQAKRAGWECWYVPESRVVHYVGQSTGVVSGDVQRRRRPKYWFQSRQHYFIKNHGIVYTMLTDLAWGLGFSLLKLRYLIQRKKVSDPEYMLRDFGRNSIFLSWLDRF